MIILFLLASAALFGWMCSRVAFFKEKDTRFWFWMGFFFGITALFIIFLLPTTKKQDQQTTTSQDDCPIRPRQAPPPFRRWYFLNEKHETQGPISSQALQLILQEGKITSSTYVWNEEMENWQPLSEVWTDSTL